MESLWKSTIKVFKLDFKRIAGTHRFSYKQFATDLVRIEGNLNSHPISGLTEDPSDITALTPGHFLEGSPIMTLPEPIAENLLLVNSWINLKDISSSLLVEKNII